MWTTDSTADSYAVAQSYDLTVAGETVYYTARNASRNGEVGAYGTASGEQQWTTTLDRVLHRIFGVHEETVFASEVYEEPGAAPVFAFDAETGEERWRTGAGVHEAGSAVSHGLCFVYSNSDGLTALDATSGEVQWEQPPSGDHGAQLYVVRDTLCLCIDGTVNGYALPDGTHRWEQSLSGDAGFIQRPPSGSAQAADLYIADDRANTALNATTGEKLWTVTRNEEAEGYGGMCLGTDSLFYHSGTALASYDLVDGTRQWAYSQGSEYEATGPFVKNGTVFLITKETNEEPSIKTFDAETGHRDWRVQLTTGDPSPPRVTGVFDEYVALRTDTGLVGLPVTPSATA